MKSSYGLKDQDSLQFDLLALARELGMIEELDALVDLLSRRAPAITGAKRCLVALIPTGLPPYVSRLLQIDHVPHGCGMHCYQDLHSCARATAPPKPLYDEYEAIAASCPLFSECATLSSIVCGLFAPISVGGQLLGAIGFEYIEYSAIGPAERFAAESISFYIGQAVERIYIKTEQRESDKAIRRFVKAQAMTHVGNWEHDLTSNVITWSDEMFHIMEFDPHGDVPQLAKILKLYDGEVIEHTDGQLMQNGVVDMPGEFDIRLNMPDGREKWIHSISHTETDSAGKPVRQYGTTMDITKRRELENQLMQVQKMESIGTFAGAIAHDFNNLLAIVQGYTEQSAEALAADDPVQEYLGSVTAATERAASLTEQLLAFAHKQAVAPVVFEINANVIKMNRMLVSIVGTRNRIQTELASDAGGIFIDPHHFEQILLNLVVNAGDAMPNGGEILIKTGNTEILETEQGTVLSSGKYVLLIVKDTGKGIPDAIKSRIFEPFFTTKTKGNGTGLGLSTVFSIVRQSGGHISVDSLPGEGTEFRVYLPFVEPRVANRSQTIETVARIANPGCATVLVVDDEPLLRSLMVTALKHRGYQVLQAADGQAALLLLEDNRSDIDLLVTDVMMPMIGGIELARQFSKSRPGVPVLLVSGFTDEIFNGEGAAIGDLPFLQKPFRMKELTERVEHIIQTAKI